MIELLVVAWVAWMMVSVLCKIVRRIKAMRTFKAKREAICFRNEPFLWMRRVV
jgi:hypothetical protein